MENDLNQKIQDENILLQCSPIKHSFESCKFFLDLASSIHHEKWIEKRRNPL